jgi:NAD(P)-dependent dehydrogenase (short-subunit alcohol dehydrogenase family)
MQMFSENGTSARRSIVNFAGATLTRAVSISDAHGERPQGRKRALRYLCFLCSEDAGFITGADILIDGGWAAQ